jgi:hypothetical protein
MNRIIHFLFKFNSQIKIYSVKLCFTLKYGNILNIALTSDSMDNTKIIGYSRRYRINHINEVWYLTVITDKTPESV